MQKKKKTIPVKRFGKKRKKKKKQTLKKKRENKGSRLGGIKKPRKPYRKTPFRETAQGQTKPLGGGKRPGQTEKKGAPTRHTQRCSSFNSHEPLENPGKETVKNLDRDWTKGPVKHAKHSHNKCLTR